MGWVDTALLDFASCAPLLFIGWVFVSFCAVFGR